MFPNQAPPPDWPKPYRSVARVFSVVGFALLALITAAVLVSAIITGDTMVALGSVVGVLLLVHLTGMSVSILRQLVRFRVSVRI